MLATNIIIQGLVLVFTGGAPSPSAPSFIQFMAVGASAVSLSSRCCGWC
jgi:hypothetical protein